MGLSVLGTLRHRGLLKLFLANIEADATIEQALRFQSCLPRCFEGSHNQL